MHQVHLTCMCMCVSVFFMCVHACVCVNLAHTLGGNVCTPLCIALHAGVTTITVQIFGVIGGSPIPGVHEAQEYFRIQAFNTIVLTLM